MRYYLLTMQENQDKFFAGMGRLGRCYAYRLKPNTTATYLAGSPENFSGPNGFLEITGVPGATIRERLGLGLLYISRGPHLFRVSTLIARCLRCTIQTYHEQTYERND